jgi:hypothetical protein
LYLSASRFRPLSPVNHDPGALLLHDSGLSSCDFEFCGNIASFVHGRFDLVLPSLAEIKINTPSGACDFEKPTGRLIKMPMSSLGTGENERTGVWEWAVWDARLARVARRMKP